MTTPAERLASTGFATVDEAVHKLGMPLDRDRVKKKPGGGNFDYLPHADVRKTANDIFGYLGWGYTVDALTCVSSGPITSKDNKEGFQCAYTCRVTLEIYAGGLTVRKGGVGGGNGFVYASTDAAAATACHENAAKLAESDALKRAFINLGDQFGLILYAKDETDRWEAEAQERAKTPEQRAAELAEARKPIVDAWAANDDRPATDDELAAVVEIAANVGDDVKALAVESIGKHQAKFHGLTSSKWLAKMTDKLLEKTRGDFLPPAGTQQTIDGPTAEQVEKAYA